MLTGNQLPCAPNNDRILVQPDPPREQSEGGLIIPNTSQVRANFGHVLAAGLVAMDRMHDHGHEIGDRIWWGQFAGVIEEWDHVTKPGKGPCEHDWSRTKSPAVNVHAFICDHCSAYRLKEPVLIMNVEDILGNETLAQRLRSGEMAIAKRNTADEQTQHVIVRKQTNGTTTRTDHATV